MTRNPMNDDDYDSNDEQISDLKELVRWACEIIQCFRDGRFNEAAPEATVFLREIDEADHD